MEKVTTAKDKRRKKQAAAKAAIQITPTPIRLKRKTTRRMKSRETKRTKTRRGKDEEGGENNEEPIDADSLDDYFRRRTFIFVHHFAGPEDPLTEAMLVEASKRKVLLKTISVEKDKGTGDLLKDEPYGTHLRWAKRGYIDAFHSGFPCATFSRLKFREVEGLPGPIRTKEEPYGRKSNTGREQQSCDDGTIMACRSINIANAVADKKTETKVRPIATLENPPESDHPQHLSAWELPEMKEFTKRSGRRVALFNTCAYQNQTPIGNRHFKPQKFVGTLMGIEQLCKRCGCGGFATHDAIIGPQKSKESGRYPDEFCEAYAKLAIQHLILMGKEEYLKERMTKLGDTIRKRKAEVVEYNTLRRPSRSPLTRRRREAEEERAKREVDVDHSSSPARPAGHNSPPPTRPRSRSPRNKRVELKPNQNKGWIEGEGKYGSLKAQKSKAEMRDPAEFVGGMRNPYETVVAMSNLLSLGIRVRAAWEAFCRQNKGAMTVAEQYGTKECWMDNKLLQNWKGHLKKVLGANAPPAVKMTPRWGYVSPLDPEIFEAWVTRGNDPEVHVSDWIRRGAPLGIESPIPTAGIFPPAEANNMDYPGQQELEDAAGQLSKGHLTNYSSVQENMEEAKVELDRYRKAGFMVDVKKEVVTKEMKHGTISKLWLIIKHKPEGIKRRIILDLRRSGGNKKATLPEKLVLPRPRDFLNSIRSVYAMQRAHGRDEGYARELAVIDVSDAFMSLAVDERELPHTLAPNIESEDFYMFVALLFGYKTAPLLWSRVAALLSRLIQSAVPGSVGQHQTYLDDAAWVLQGSLAERNETLAFILYTMAALGFRISLQKGMRSTQVTWVGVRFTVTPDHVIIGLPEKFVTELVELLESWHNKGMVAIKELRQAAGRVSWMSGILPRTRWVVATFYKVLHERLNDVATGAEAIRRSNRQDTRPKDHLFAVKQLEQPRQWLVTYLRAALLKPTRKYKLDIGKYPKATIVTDASPLGLGAILLVNNKATRALAFKVTETDAHQLGFKDCWKEAGSQGIVETLAVLVAIKTWMKELASCQVELKVQSDSMVALAVTQRLSNSTSSLNFLGAEIAVQCEIAGVENLKASNIPGAASVAADWLSRPQKEATTAMPPELEGVPICRDEELRVADYYKLPTPASAPALWFSGAAANDIWASTR